MLMDLNQFCSVSVGELHDDLFEQDILALCMYFYTVTVFQTGF